MYLIPSPHLFLLDILLMTILDSARTRRRRGNALHCVSAVEGEGESKRRLAAARGRGGLSLSLSLLIPWSHCSIAFSPS